MREKNALVLYDAGDSWRVKPQLRPSFAPFVSLRKLWVSAPIIDMSHIAEVRGRSREPLGHAHLGQGAEICHLLHDVCLANDSNDLIVFSYHESLHSFLNHLSRCVHEAG